MKKILLTGGAGFIGSHTALTLLKKNYHLIIIDSLINSSFKSIERLIKLHKDSNPKELFNLEFVKGDIRESQILEKVFKDNKVTGKPIEGVIHFAGLKSVNQSIDNPLDYWDVNVKGTINLLKVMERFDCYKFVFSSSASIYGSSDDKKLTEEDLICPTNPYGFTKATIEKILENISISNKSLWSIISLRYFNPIGAHPSGLIGEDPLNNTNNIFPIINKVAKGQIKYLQIFGNDWPTHDGTCIRDYIHVMDLAEGHSLALDYLFKENFSEFLTLNIGSGKGISVLELVNQFQKANDVKVPFVFTKRRKGDTPIVVANNFKLKKLLNWVPKRNIDEMCKDGWKWQILNPKGY